MAEAKSRRESSPRPRTRIKPDPGPNGEAPESADRPAPLPAAPAEPAVLDGVAREGPLEERDGAEERAGARPQPRGTDEDGYAGFDEEINSRYEEIKRGSTHIS